MGTAPYAVSATASSELAPADVAKHAERAIGAAAAAGSAER
jgi:hypothetical protein